MSETKVKVFKQMIFRKQEDLFHQRSAPKPPATNIFAGLSENQAVEKTKKLMHFLVKFRYKIACKTNDNKKLAFIKLSLNHRKTILSKIAFEKIKTLILKKNLDGVYTFFNKACPNKFRWKTVKNFDEMFGLSYKAWDFTRKDIDDLEFKKMRKIVADLSVSGAITHVLKIDLSVLRIFLTEKYGLKILRLLFENLKKKFFLSAFLRLMMCRDTKQHPKVLQHFLQMKVKEKADIEKFLKKDQVVKNHKSHERILSLHNRELNMVSERLQDPQSIRLRVRENLILNNWAGQILNRIAKFYRREFLNWGFSGIYRKYQNENYRKKVLINLYERYRCARMRDLTFNFLRWKLKSFDPEKFRKIKTLIVALRKVVRKAKRSKFLDFLMRLPEKEGGKLITSRKIRAVVLVLQVLEKKKLIVLESVFRRIKEEEFLVEVSERIQALEKIFVIYEKTGVRSAFLQLRKDAEKRRKVKQLLRSLDFMFRIRKVVNFYKIMAFAKLSKEKD